ncbi:QueG-associated DUF1730 domain-containing protein, partial [Vibrio parahaemolyticus]
VRMNYLPAKAAFASTLNNPELGYISRYALGRDYHKLLKKRLKVLSDRILAYCREFDGMMLANGIHVDDLNFRPFVDSAP